MASYNYNPYQASDLYNVGAYGMQGQRSGASQQNAATQSMAGKSASNPHQAFSDLGSQWAQVLRGYMQPAPLSGGGGGPAYTIGNQNPYPVSYSGPPSAGGGMGGPAYTIGGQNPFPMNPGWNPAAPPAYNQPTPPSYNQPTPPSNQPTLPPYTTPPPSNLSEMSAPVEGDPRVIGPPDKTLPPDPNNPPPPDPNKPQPNRLLHPGTDPRETLPPGDPNSLNPGQTVSDIIPPSTPQPDKTEPPGRIPGPGEAGPPVTLPPNLTGPPAGQTPPGNPQPVQPSIEEIYSYLQRLLGPENQWESNQLTRSMNANAALTGDINSGGFGETSGRAQAQLAANQGARVSEILNTDTQNAANRAVDIYGMNNNYDLGLLGINAGIYNTDVNDRYRQMYLQWLMTQENAIGGQPIVNLPGAFPFGNP